LEIAMARIKRLTAMLVSVLAVGALQVVGAGSPAQADDKMTLKFELRSAWNNKCVEVLGFNNDNGAGVGAWDCWGGSNQQWYWDPTRQAIRSVMNHKCLEILSFNNNNGAQLGMWDCWGGANQRWTYPGAYDQAVTIKSLFNLKYMDLLYYDYRNGAWVGAWARTGASNQWWQTRHYVCAPGECPIG
jgi:hypothetical protein